MIKSVAALSISQGAVYVVPLFTVPYLTRILGVEQYGLLGMATSIVAYLTLVTEWGFNWSATQAIAVNTNDLDAVKHIFWDTIFAKSILAAVCLVVFLPMIVLVPELRHFSDVLLLSLLPVLANVLTVNWFLQGTEQFVGLATVTLIGRLSSIPLIFAFVHSPSDTKIAALIQGVSFLGPAIASFALAMRAVPLASRRFRLSGAIDQIRSSVHLFISQAAINLYTRSNLVVLGLMAGPTQAGLFFAADRLRGVVYGLMSPVSTALYPRINNLLSRSPAKALRLMLLMLIGQAGFTFLTSMVLLLIAKPLTLLLLGHGFEKGVTVLQWLSVLPFLSGVNTVLGIQIMLPLGMKREFTRSTILAGIMNFGLLFPLTHFFGAVGAAASAVITETVVTLLMGTALFRHRESLRTLSRTSEINAFPKI